MDLMPSDTAITTAEVPDHLPTLGRGSHCPGAMTPCAMEAAAWLAGEPWSDHPRTVHPVIASVARATNDHLEHAERQLLWPLILASLGTAHSRKPLLSWRLKRLAAMSDARTGAELRRLWEQLLVVHDRFAGRAETPTASGTAARLSV